MHRALGSPSSGAGVADRSPPIEDVWVSSLLDPGAVAHLGLAPGKVVEALGLSGAKLLACDVGQLAASLGLQRLGHKKLFERGVGAVRWVDEGWRM